MLVGKRVLVLGNGVCGKAVFDYVQKNGGIPQFWSDESDFTNQEFDFAVISPGIPKDSDIYINVKGSGIPIFSELDFAYLTSRFNSISVSGTNGKTTVVNLVAGMLSTVGVSCSTLGNVGVPFCMHDDSKWQICEISSFSLEQSRFFRTDYSCVVNVTVDHLDYHKTLTKYRNSKEKLYSFTKKGVVFEKDEQVASVKEGVKELSYSLKNNGDIQVRDNSLIYVENGREYNVLNLSELRLKGEHNVQNVACALGLCILANGYDEKYANFLREYKGEKYRNAFIGVIKSKKIFNDSKGTNVSSVIASYKTMEGRTALLLGGYDKHESYDKLFDIMREYDVVYAFGDNAKRICREAGIKNIINHLCNNIEEATIKAINDDVDNVLFSPGCSSFDRFSGFEARGAFFDELIKKLKI